MRLPMLTIVLATILTSGCAAHSHTRTVFVSPSPPPAVQHSPSPTYVQYHYVYINSRWHRRTGPRPSTTSHYHRPQHYRPTVIHRSTSSRPSVRQPPRRTGTSTSTHRSTNHRHTKDCRHRARRSTPRR